MRLGVVVMPTDPWPDTVARVQHIEALGYDHLWVYDHLSWRHYRDRPWHATYPWLAAVSQHTQSIRIGTMVSNPNIRHPVTLAKDAMTIDQLSEGRLTIGLGAGGTGFDATVLGQAPLTAGQRVQRLEEFTHVLAGLLSGELSSHHGDWFDVDGARMLPGCVQRPRVPLALAGGGPRALRLVAAMGDAWITLGDTVTGDSSAEGTERAVRAQQAMLDENCASIGRDPATIDRIFLVGHSESKPLRSIDAFTDFVGRYEEIGFTDIVFHDPRPDDPVWNEPTGIVDDIAASLLA